MSVLEPLHESLRLLERLPLVTYTLRREAPSPLVYLSPQSEATFGFSAADFFRDDFWESLMVAEDRPRFLAAIERLRVTGERMEVEYRVTTAGGDPIWIRDTAAADGDLIHGYLVDITREKELEHELARERATLDAFFNDSSIGLAISDADDRYVRMNDALARLTGRPAEAFVGRTLAEVVPDLAAEVERRRPAAGHSGTFEIEFEDSETVGFVTYFPFAVEGVDHFGRVVVDVTEERRAQASERQLRNLIEQLPLVAYVNDVAPLRAPTYVSPRIEELTGYPPEAFLAEPELGDRIIHPDDFDAIVEREQAARRSATPFEHEYRIVRADGGVRWVLDRMETVYDDAGNAQYELGFLVDVTETHETANLLRAVWDGAFEAIVVADDDGRYVDVNPAACELFGRSREEILASRVGALLDWSSSTDWDTVRAASGVVQGDAVVRRADGSEREVEFAARASFLPGRHLSVIRDTTEHRQLQRDLWRAQKLESVARLAGGVAHDFNNLLTAIRGYAHLLRARVEPASAEAQHALEIDRAAERAAALTAQLLALGRRQTLRARPLDLNRHLEGLRDSLVELAGPRHELVLDLDPGLRAVRVDGGLFAQVVANLVTNAVEAMADGGAVLVRTENTEVRGRDDLPDGTYVVLSVHDSGHGLDQATLEHVFEPFFTTKEFGTGSGLGLASAYGTVRQSGGTITVESALGRGSTFSVYLPEAGGAEDAPPRLGAGETILVVERDPAVSDLILEVLTDLRYCVLTTRTSVEALRLAERFDGAIDLLLGDVEPARLRELGDELRRARPTLRTLSLEKPYAPGRLRRAVRAALDSAAPAAEAAASD
jgi:PAS domain S-box-containing protein